MDSLDLLVARYRAISPLLDQCSVAIASQSVEEVETAMDQCDAILAEITGLLPANPAAAEGLAGVIRTVLYEVDANRARLEEWKELVQASLGHLKVGGQAVDCYHAMSGNSSDELFRVRA